MIFALSSISIFEERRLIIVREIKRIKSKKSREELLQYIKAPNNILKHYQYYTKADIKKLKKVGYLKKFKTLEDGIKCYIKKQ